MGFPSKLLIVVLDHAERGVGRLQENKLPHGEKTGLSKIMRTPVRVLYTSPAEELRAKNHLKILWLRCRPIL